MAFQGNAFALLEGEDGENLLARVSTAAVKPELPPPSAVDKRSRNNKKPLDSSLQSSSAPQQHSLDNEKRRYNRNGVERQNRNGGVERQNTNSFDRQNRNGFERQSRNSFNGYNRDGAEKHNGYGAEASTGHGNGAQQNYRGGPVFKRNNGSRHDERPSNGFKRSEGRSNGHHKKEEVTNGDSNGHQKVEEATNGDSNGHQKKEDLDEEDGWQTVVRSSSHKQSNANQRQAPREREGSVSRRERNYGNDRRTEINNGNGSEVLLEDKQGDNVVPGDIVENLNGNTSRDETENRKMGRFGGKGRANRGNYQRRRVDVAAQDNGKVSESKEILQEKEEGIEGNENSLKEADSSKGKQEKVLSKEEIERLEWEENKLKARKLEQEAEAKKMTLKQYEKQFEEKRKVLESLKTEERRVSLDKDFNSMHIVAKKNEEEAIFLKLNSAASDKQKKKVANSKEDINSQKVKKIVLEQAPTAGRGGRYPRRDDGRNGGSNGRQEGSGNGSVSIGKAARLPPSFKDAEQFPALGLEGTSKGN